MPQDDVPKPEIQHGALVSNTLSVDDQDLERLGGDSRAQTDATNDDDINPRSPKRRRISITKDDDPFDIGAAAARALALSLGGDVASINLTRNISQTQHNDTQEHLPIQNTLPSPSSNTVRQSRLDGLSVLNDLASQILVFLARLNHLEIGEMLFGPPSARGQEYRGIKQRFDETKKVYITPSSPFLSIQTLEYSEAEQIDMVRRTNLAIFMSSIFSGEIGLRIMDINFIEVFVPEGGRLLKAQGSIYLELKTHAFMAATRTASTMLNQVMMDLFPSDMDKHLLQKRPGAKGLAPSEQDFLNRLGSRRDILYSVIRSNKLNTLPDTYRWNDFAREVSMYLTKFMENDIAGVKDNFDGMPHHRSDLATQQEHIDGQRILHSLTNVENNGPIVAGMSQPNGFSNGLDLSFDIQAMVAQAARAAALSMGDGIDMTLLPPATGSALTDFSQTTTEIKEASSLTFADGNSNNVGGTAIQDGSDGPAQLPQANARTADNSDIGLANHQDPSEVPHSSQTAPTQVLYERARLVNTNKALSLKKSALPTHRRPWTTEEENALMTGLDEVKGPHWSQILAMYGPGGTVNESLKDRNQVQLKDKARNLKLFFLKAGIEVPYYLQAVTGDLKTRAPGQAEKMERERMQGEPEKLSQDDALGNTDQLDLNETDTVNSAERSPIGDQETEGAASGQHEGFDASAVQEFDMEAMIAQAAASASRGLGPPTSTR